MKRALEVLADGSWHDMNAVVLEMTKMITPGQALRRAEKIRLGQSRGVPPAQRAVPRSAEYLRLLGGRHIAREALRNSKRLEFKDDENGRWVRIKPHLIVRSVHVWPKPED